MKRIFKYRLPGPDGGPRFQLPIPPDSKCVLIAMQGGARTAWFEVDPTRQGIAIVPNIQIEKVNTGGGIEPGWRHLGSLIDAELVWHYYERSR